jgi:hypothetical protein
MKTTAILCAAAVLAIAATPALANEEHMEAKVDHYFAKMDTNSDGSVSKAEHDAFGTEMFNKADANTDGSLTKEELTAAKKAEKEEWKADEAKH